MFKILSSVVLSACLATSAFAAPAMKAPATGIIQPAPAPDRTITNSIGSNSSLYKAPQSPTFKVNPSLNKMNCAGASASTVAPGATRPTNVPAGSSCP